MGLEDTIAETPGFVEMWRAGITRREIAERLGCHLWAVKKAARKLRLLHPNANEIGLLAVAPNNDEERLSQATLALAPSVAVRAYEVKRRALHAYSQDQPTPFGIRNYRNA